jgi:hypothetical protein
MSLKEFFIREGARKAGFLDSGVEVPKRSCQNCIKRVQSYPYNCNDGWPLGNPKWQDRGNRCANWKIRKLEK